jgi:hypothetical protein
MSYIACKICSKIGDFTVSEENTESLFLIVYFLLEEENINFCKLIIQCDATSMIFAFNTK